MKILFIEPKSPNLHIFSRFGLPRLGTVLLATIARRAGHDATVCIEEIQDIDWEEVKRADLVGISSITSTAPRAYAIADKIRGWGIKVVMGGPHPTYLSEEAAAHADFVLKGEAETTFLELIEHLEGKRPLTQVPNLVSRVNGSLVRGPKDTRVVDITQNPHPDFSLVQGFHEARGIVNKRLIPVQISRGCPFDCSFCSVTGMFGRRMRYRNTHDVMNELLKYNTRDTHIFFYDDNFAADRNRAKELLRAMEEADTQFVWSTQLRIDAAGDEELVQRMRKTRCETVYIGIESVNATGLQQVRKRQTVDEAFHGVRVFRKNGISVHGMFILGLDTDTPKVVRDTVRFAKKAGIGSLQALLLTPLPGTKVFEQFEQEGRILFQDWSLYDAHHVVFQHPTMTPEQLQQAQMQVHTRFYSRAWVLTNLFRFQMGLAGVALYARGLNRRWKGKNALYLKALKLLNHSKELEVTVDLKLPCCV